MVIYEGDVEVKVEPKRMWQAMVKDSHNFFTKSCTGRIHSASLADHDEKEGVKVGVIRNLEFCDGIPKFSRSKVIFEEVDDDNLKVKIKMLEGGWIGLDLSHCHYSYWFKEAPHGCTLHFSMECEGFNGLPEEQHEFQEMLHDYVNSFEAYLLTHDDYKT